MIEQFTGGHHLSSDNSTQATTPNPGLVWDTLNGYQRTAALRTGIELDLFTAVGSGVANVEELAKRTDASPRGIRILCDYLTVAGFLSKEGAGYSLTPTSAVFLDSRSPACMSPVVNFVNSPKVMSGFANLTQTVKRGSTSLAHDGFIEAELDEWVTFAKSMRPLVGPASRFIANDIAQSGKSPRRVLDIAAGHGLFGIAVALGASEAVITAQDWPNVLKVAEDNAKSAGLGERHKLLPGDAFKVEFGADYDVVLLTNFLHHFNQQTCVTFLQKIYGCLNPGGRLYTLEFVPNEDRVTPPIPAMFSMMMLGLTPAGDAYTEKELKAMLGSAGFRQNEFKSVLQSPETVIVSTK